MDITQGPRISVSLGQKINMGNYESRDIHYSLSDSVQPDETIAQCKARLYEVVKGWMAEDVALQREKVQRRA